MVVAMRIRLPRRSIANRDLGLFPVRRDWLRPYPHLERVMSERLRHGGQWHGGCVPSVDSTTAEIEGGTDKNAPDSLLHPTLFWTNAAGTVTMHQKYSMRN